MTCDEFSDRLSDFVNEELPIEIRATFEQHLVVCPHCGSLIATYRATITLVRALPRCDAQLPEPIQARLWERFQQALQEEP